MFRLLSASGRQYIARGTSNSQGLSILSEGWNVTRLQPAICIQSCAHISSAETAQLQQQQSKQQHLRHQDQPAQQQQTDHLKALQNDPALRRKMLVNRLLYRSRQRGFLEMDLLVGIWAEKQVPLLDEDMLHQFEQVLDQENPDLYKWLTGQKPPPPIMAQNAAYQVHNLSDLQAALPLPCHQCNLVQLCGQLPTHHGCIAYIVLFQVTVSLHKPLFELFKHMHTSKSFIEINHV